MINSALVKHGDFRVYIPDNVLLGVKLLLIDKLSKPSSDITLLNYLISELTSNNIFDIDKIDSELISLNLLQETLDSIYKRIEQEGAYYKSNEFIHEVYKTLNNTLDRKTCIKAIAVLSDRFDKTILDQLSKVVRVSFKIKPFKTISDLSLNNIIGSWISINIESTPDYEINWNMTDYTVSHSMMKLEITQNNFSVIVPALDYSIKSECLLSLITGNLSINKGNLIIEGNNVIREIPVLEQNDDILKLYVFKTIVKFQKSNE